MIRYRKAAGALLLSAALLLSPAGCRADDAAESEPTASASPEDAVSRPISVTFSEALLHETGLDPAATARGLGLTNVTDNDDGSCTIQMTAEEQETASAALRESLDEQLLALPESGTWPFLDAVELSEDCTKATLHSAAARYSPARDNTVAQAVYIPALLCAALLAIPAAAAETSDDEAAATRPGPVQVWGTLTWLDDGGLYVENSSGDETLDKGRCRKTVGLAADVLERQMDRYRAEDEKAAETAERADVPQK